MFLFSDLSFQILLGDIRLEQFLRFFYLGSHLSWGHFEGVGTQSLARPTRANM